jgi:feruloyl esterase
MRQESPTRQPVSTRSFGLVAALCAVLWSLSARADEGCHALRRLMIPPDQIGLPTSGAEVISSSHHREGGTAYCRVMGRIHPVDPSADDIRFEVNLPEASGVAAGWNGKALQYGGGTFDGYLAAADGCGRTAVGLRSQPTPLTRGYATFGSDGGHHHVYFPFPDAINAVNARFARNAEQQRNFAGDAIKKVHDAAVVIMTQHYGRGPRRMYFIGGSTGGREALRAAQAFPADYDGVLAAYAAWDQAELDLQFVRTAQRACDAQDGLRDGIIADTADCHVPLETLACTGASHPHGCLSPAQLHTLETFATPQRTAMPLSHGVDSIPGYNVLSGADLGRAVGLLHFPLRDPVIVLNSFGYVIGDDVTRNFIPVGRHFDARTFDTVTGGPWHDDLLRQAAEIDATDTDLRPFFRHGGKLILVHGSTDTVIPTESSVDYYERLRRTVGAEATERSARLYIVPGLGHGFGRFLAGFDTVGTLDAWADGDVAPRNLVVTDNHSGRTRPLCDWPAWPRYTGSGDPRVAASFTCALPASRQVAVR